MKKILYILFVTMLTVSCGEKISNNNGTGNNGNNEGGENGGETPELTFEQKMLGEWYCPSLTVGGEAYLNLMEDKTFELYQKIGEGAYRLFRGTWNLEGTLLTGKYNDGEDWAAAYTVVLENSSMTLTSQNDAEETSIFTKTEIPESVINSSVTIVKSGI